MMKCLVIVLFAIGLMACSSTKKIGSNPEDQNQLPDPSTVYFERQKRGVDFFATDEDKSWQLEIDYHNNVRFSAGNLTKDFNVKILTLGEGLKGSVVKHEVKNNDSKLTIDIRICDSPFDKGKFNAFDVDVNYLDLKTNEEKNYKGRGCFYGDIQLHCKWKLKSINGKQLDSNNLLKDPYVEFHLDKDKVTGFLGCNSFTSDVYFGRNQVTFSHVSRTKIACANSNVEGQFFKVISNQEFNYSIEGQELTLENESGVVVFEKVD